VHTVDISDACGLEGEAPDDALRLSLAVMAETVRRRHLGLDVLRALGGRAGLEPGFTVFG
jgi:hypothetical protein